jgi:hypothetical protein
MIHVSVVVCTECRASGVRGCDACVEGCVPSGGAFLVHVDRGSHLANVLSECEGWGDCGVSDSCGEGGAGVTGSSFALCGVYLSCETCDV